MGDNKKMGPRCMHGCLEHRKITFVCSDGTINTRICLPAYVRHNNLLAGVIIREMSIASQRMRDPADITLSNLVPREIRDDVTVEFMRTLIDYIVTYKVYMPGSESKVKCFSQAALALGFVAFATALDSPNRRETSRPPTPDFISSH